MPGTLCGFMCLPRRCSMKTERAQEEKEQLLPHWDAPGVGWGLEAYGPLWAAFQSSSESTLCPAHLLSSWCQVGLSTAGLPGTRADDLAELPAASSSSFLTACPPFGHFAAHWYFLQKVTWLQEEAKLKPSNSPAC